MNTNTKPIAAATAANKNRKIIAAKRPPRRERWFA
jgi:hypothetical protein